jgi:hypothetical protein
LAVQERKMWWKLGLVLCAFGCAKAEDTAEDAEASGATCADYCAEFFAFCEELAITDYNNQLNCQSVCEEALAPKDAADHTDHGATSGDNLECRHSWAEAAADDPAACANATLAGGEACVDE